MRMIQPQCRNRCAAKRRQSRQLLRLPDQVLPAEITTRMKQSHNLTTLRVDTRNVRSLEIVTVKASVGEILSLGRAAVKSRNYVIKLERSADKRLGQ